MNKLVKGSIAGAAGIALLLGGAGTLASWNDSATVLSSATKITAGTLEIKAAPASGDGWKVNGISKDLSNFKIVPGDVLTYTSTFNVTATGDNLSAAVALGSAAITPVDTAKDADVKLAAALTSGATFQVNGKAASAVTVSPAAGTQAVVVTVRIPYTSTTFAADNLSKLGQVNLAGFNVTLTQNN
ncbi:alternate-type signal peptide domain-containing protein [Rhodoglobus sp. NPDC076762]